MRTPEEMAREIIEKATDRKYPSVAYLLHLTTSLLTAWRDECVEGSNSWKKGFEAGQLAARTATRSEAPASEDGYCTAFSVDCPNRERMLYLESTLNRIANITHVDARKYGVDVIADVKAIARDALLSRAPRAESDYYEDAVKAEEHAKHQFANAMSFKRRAEAAEAERDRLLIRVAELEAKRG